MAGSRFGVLRCFRLLLRALWGTMRLFSDWWSSNSIGWLSNSIGWLFGVAIMEVPIMGIRATLRWATGLSAGGFSAPRFFATGLFFLVGTAAMVWPARSIVWAISPESPEVRKLISDGLRFLEKKTDNRMGGKCLIGLTFLKDGASPEHPRIQEALQVCQVKASKLSNDELVYGNGLAILFLAELDPVAHRELIKYFAKVMSERQKSHGGWGYENRKTGDTSQTQYATLCYWELMRIGIPPDVDSVDRCTNWLLRTQDPSGVWGYQGKDPGDWTRVNQMETRLSMGVAGLGSLLICGNMLSLLKSLEVGQDSETSVQKKLPSSLRLVKGAKKQKMSSLRGSQVEVTRFKESIKLGQQWVAKNFQPSVGRYNNYYLYSLERYKSFEELATGNAPAEPGWYQQGYEVLKNTQRDSGGWQSLSSAPCATAFSVLFLLRSTQKSIKSSLGEGTLMGGRGLSANLNRMKMRHGKLITLPDEIDADGLLAMLENPKHQNLDTIGESPTVLNMDQMGEEQARRLQQIVRSGSPESRLIAVRTLAQMRRLKYVPSLMYALSDPDRRVVREARDGLRFISRRIGGFGLPDNFTERQRYDTIDKWKQWYQKILTDDL
jgi:hypothetical protein